MENQNLITVPTNLRSQIDRAQNLLAQSETAEAKGDHSLAVVKAREGMEVLKLLAKVAPNYATLIIAGQMGYRGYQFETIEHVDRYQVVDRTYMGISFGHEVVNVPTITRRSIRVSLF